MAYMLALAASLGLMVSAQSTRSAITITTSATMPDASGTVIDVTIPGGSQYSDPLVASVIGVTSDLTTLELGCTPGFDIVACDFYPSVTVTAGPTTFSISQEFPEQTLTIETRCFITSERPGGAICTVLAIGNAGDQTRDRSYDGTVINTYSASEVLLYPVTATAGETAELAPDTTITVIPTLTTTGTGINSDDGTTIILTSSRSSSTSTSSRSRSNPTTTGGPTTTAQVASTPTPAAANMLAPGIIAGGLAGFLAFLL